MMHLELESKPIDMVDHHLDFIELHSRNKSKM